MKLTLFWCPLVGPQPQLQLLHAPVQLLVQLLLRALHQTHIRSNLASNKCKRSTLTCSSAGLSCTSVSDAFFFPDFFFFFLACSGGRTPSCRVAGVPSSVSMFMSLEGAAGGIWKLKAKSEPRPVTDSRAEDASAWSATSEWSAA